MSAQTVEERLASIEATLPHLATKADVARLDSKIDSLKWVLGSIIGVVGIALTLLQIFLP